VPLTFLSHQAVVVPLKVGAPRLTSGTALVLGSMAPDVEYFVRGYPTSTIGHTWVGQLTFCLPVTMALFWVVTRLIAEPAAANAPEGGDLHLPDYALIRQQPVTARHWMIVAVSALVGSASHVLLDRIPDGWGGMPYHALAASRAWVAVNVGLWILLAAITLIVMRHIGRHGLLWRWAAERSGDASSLDDGRIAGRRAAQGASDPNGSSGNPGAFWGWVFFCMVTGAMLGAYYRRPGFFLDQYGTWVHIWLCAVSGAFIGLVLASAAWQGARWRAVQLRGNQQ
jgi:uncharacterized protein DUF4184